MVRHIVVFIYIFSSFFGMTGIILYWLLSKKKALKDAAEFIRLRKFMTSTFLIGLISFFTFYSQYIIFRQPSSTAYRILDYLFWVCFIFYWIDYLGSMVDGNFLHKLTKIVKYGCLGYIVIWIFTTAQIWDIGFTIMNQTSKILFVLLDILFCLLALLVVIIYVIRGQRQIESKLSGFYIFAVSTALMLYAIWEFLLYMDLFADIATPKAWELNPLNATAFFLFFTNLITLVYVYYNDFACGFLKETEIGQAENGQVSDVSATTIKTDAINNSSAFNTAVARHTADPAAFFTAENGNVAAVDYTVAPVHGNASAGNTPEDIANEHNLTPREMEVMEFVYKGFNNAEIAGELYISQNTVKHHIYNLFRKLNVNNRVELICMLQEYYS